MDKANRLKMLQQLRPAKGIEAFHNHREFVEWQAKVAPLLNFNQFYYTNWIELSGRASIPGLSSYTYDPLFSQMDNILVQAISELEHNLTQPAQDKQAMQANTRKTLSTIVIPVVTALIGLMASILAAVLSAKNAASASIIEAQQRTSGGIIAVDGSNVARVGRPYTISREAPGRTRITFDAGFDRAPIAVATSHQSVVPTIARVVFSDERSLVVATRRVADDSPEDAPFSFLVLESTLKSP